jgi:membrane protease YdiL (CAAX protease family)
MKFMKKNFLILWLAGVISTVIALPYIFALQSSVLAASPLPLWQIAVISVAQASLLLAVAVFFGLKLAKAIDLPALAFLESGVMTKDRLISIAKLAVPLGIAVAVVIKLADVFFLKHIPQLAIAAKEIAIWKTVLVAPYGGVVEELLMRLFLVSLFAWLLAKAFRVAKPTGHVVIMWTAITITAVIFGLGHLPATATIVPLTTLVIVRAILLNGIGGLVFGWLYWKKGLDYAMVSHFTADIFIHTIILSLMR